MSEYITHESYVASARKRVVDTARSMLNGDLNFLEGARNLVDLSHEAAVRVDDADFMVFVAIDSETDDLPIGAARQQWPLDVLEKLDPEYKKAEAWAKEFGSQACEALVRRFHV